MRLNLWQLETISLSHSLARNDFLLSQLPFCYCDKMPRWKQLKGKRVSFGSQFEMMVLSQPGRHGGRQRIHIKGKQEAKEPHCIHTQETEGEQGPPPIIPFLQRGSTTCPNDTQLGTKCSSLCEVSHPNQSNPREYGETWHWRLQPSIPTPSPSTLNQQPSFVIDHLISSVAQIMSVGLILSSSLLFTLCNQWRRPSLTTAVPSWIPD